MSGSSKHDQPVIITIDGPAGTGKSTVAHRLAVRLGLSLLDTGAMYRAAAVIAIEQNIDPSAGMKLANAVQRANMSFDWHADPPRIMLGDRDISQRIRDMDVSGIVSIVAAQPEVREVLVKHQRRIAQEYPRLVSEGRDQGSVVFPNADLRFFLDADESVRANRRAAQLAEAGKTVDQSKVAQDIRNRDHLDSTRSDSPLVRPPGAIEINTGNMSVEEVVDRLVSMVHTRLPEAGLKS